MRKGWLAALVAAVCVCACVPALAQVTWLSDTGVQVHSATLEGEEWLFLPSGTDLSALRLSVDGAAAQIHDWTAAGEEVQPGVLRASPDGGNTMLRVLRSENLRSVHITSRDPVSQGRAWVEDCTRHQNEATVTVSFLRADGSLFFTDRSVRLRGRGNNTWSDTVKKPYQLKLSDPMDLLEGNEPSRTWVLLSHNRDESMLHNQLAMDTARELGMLSTPKSEQADVYYDGEYRGTYLISEKIAVGENGVDIADFDRLLEEANRRMGSPDPDEVAIPTVMEDGLERPAPDGENSFGLRYGYVQGVLDFTDVDAGGYLLELEGLNSLSDHTWFEISNDRYIAVKNPEYAGETMMRYVSELFENAFQAMTNLGEHPLTGQKLETMIDIDSFTRSHLVQELFLSEDGYEWSSTFFFIPQGETKIYAGPVWDFDRIIADYPGLKDDNAFSRSFYRTTVFQRAAKALCQNELEPLVSKVLLGAQEGVHLRPLTSYQEKLLPSWRMNYYLYEAPVKGWTQAEENFRSTMDALEHFLREQSAFLFEEIALWNEDEPTLQADIHVEFICGDVDNLAEVYMENEPYASIYLRDKAVECIRPATQDEYALWQLELTVAAKPDCVLAEDLVLCINGDEFEGQRTQREVTFRFTFEDPSYRPALLDGEDYGLVFNYDSYLENYPEAAEEGDDPESVLRYFCENGMAYGDMGNEFFDPIVMLETFTHLTDTFGGDWNEYYEAFMRDPALWAYDMGLTFQPEWQDAD